MAIDLLKNYGQHTAVFAGLRHSEGRYAITMDDDLQNPPEEIPPLLAKAEEGYDLVIGRFERKRHSLSRRWGSKLVDWMNRRVFHKPKGLVLTSFRCIRRDVVDRMADYRTAYPYIPGLALMFSRSRVNIPVEHHPRTVGKSNYSLLRILAVVLTDPVQLFLIPVAVRVGPRPHHHRLCLHPDRGDIHQKPDRRQFRAGVDVGGTHVGVLQRGHAVDHLDAR